jgi:hypothetical protein
MRCGASAAFSGAWNTAETFLLVLAALFPVVNPRRHAARPPTSRRRSVIPCSGKKFPVPATEIPCFRMEGIGCKLLNSLGDRLPKPRQKARIGRNFQKFPSLFSGNAWISYIRFRHPSPIPTID